MAQFRLELSEDELPGPGEVAQLEQNGFVVLIENVNPPSQALDADQAPPTPGDIIKYVPVAITAPTSVVRHAAAVYQRNARTRVARWTLCDRSRTREVARRLDAEPLTNVTCAQCRRALAAEGLLSN